MRIVVLGGGRVSRAFTAWCSALNLEALVVQSQQQQQQTRNDPIVDISIFSRQVDTAVEDFVTDAPWLRNAKFQRGVRFLKNSSDAAEHIKDADAVFTAVPLPFAAMSLSETQPHNNALLDNNSQCPIFLISRGISPRPLTKDNATQKLFSHGGTATFVQRRSAADFVESDEMHCAATSIEDLALRKRVVALGGLLSSRMILDAASMRANWITTQLVRKNNNSNVAVPPRLLELASPPALFAAAGSHSASENAVKVFEDAC